MAIRGNVTAADLEILTREQIGVIRPCDIPGGAHEQDDENDAYSRTFLAHSKEIRVRDCVRNIRITWRLPANSDNKPSCTDRRI